MSEKCLLDAQKAEQIGCGTGKFLMTPSKLSWSIFTNICFSCTM